MAGAWPKIMRAYISGSALRIFFIFCSMIGHYQLIKITEVKLPKKFSFGSDGHFWLVFR